MKPTKYEVAVCEYFRMLFPENRYIVTHNTKEYGKKSRIRRQIDICVSEIGQSKPLAMAEVKCHRRSINVNQAGSIVALAQDVGAKRFWAISTCGFSQAAQNHLEAEGYNTIVINTMDAQAFLHVEGIRKFWNLDREFRHDSGLLAQAILSGRCGDSIQDDYPDLLFEEWEGIVYYTISTDEERAFAALRHLARHSYDDGERYSALRILLEHDAIAHADAVQVAALDDSEEMADLMEAFPIFRHEVPAP
jgi:hypothetical protein